MNDEQSMQRSAFCTGPYRYILMRTWEQKARGITFVMLNPSTADHLVDDPTIRRCLGFARTWGYGSLAVVNLYALRATNPAELAHHEQPCGPENGTWIAEASRGADVVVAWGANVGPLPEAAQNAARIVLQLSARVDCLGFTLSGHPRHPLYVRATTERIGCRAALVKLFGL